MPDKKAPSYPVAVVPRVVTEQPADGGTGLPAGEPTVEPSPAAPASPAQLAIRLRPGSTFSTYTDPQTHLVVTAEWQTVDARLVGHACRCELAIELKGL